MHCLHIKHHFVASSVIVLQCYLSVNCLPVVLSVYACKNLSLKTEYRWQNLAYLWNNKKSLNFFFHFPGLESPWKQVMSLKVLEFHLWSPWNFNQHDSNKERLTTLLRFWLTGIDSMTIMQMTFKKTQSILTEMLLNSKADLFPSCLETG